MIEEKKQIDYSKFFEKGKEKEIPEKRKKFSFGSLITSLKNFWSESDKKTKIELVVFLVVIVLIAGILIFYLAQPKGSEILSPPLPVEY